MFSGSELENENKQTNKSTTKNQKQKLKPEIALGYSFL